MSLEIVDELMTPGCPQCAVKHLSAALSYLLHPRLRGLICPSRVLLAVAKINLAEVLVGYDSHLWYAVGMLQRAEETALGEGSTYAVARHARLILEEKGRAGAAEALHSIELGAVFEPEEKAEAHLYEAARELPDECAYPVVPNPDNIVRTIERIRKEYFDLPEAAVAEGETTTNKGEPEMATNKAAVAKKAGKTKVPAASAAKATHAACKGGKCKGKPCKK